MQQNKMDAIEKQEIRGLSFKSLFTLVACTITICGTVLASYYSLRSDIRDLQSSRTISQQYFDQRLLYIETRLKQLEDYQHNSK